MRCLRGFGVAMVMLWPVDRDLSGASEPDENGRNLARADHAPSQPRFNYVEVLQKSLLFFDAQRSGKLRLASASGGGAIRRLMTARTRATTFRVATTMPETT